jgi:hypothetical protein
MRCHVPKFWAPTARRPPLRRRSHPQSLLEKIDCLKQSILAGEWVCLIYEMVEVRRRQSHALGAINGIDQLPKTSEAAAMRSKNEPRQSANFGLVLFLR